MVYKANIKIYIYTSHEMRQKGGYWIYTIYINDQLFFRDRDEYRPRPDTTHPKPKCSPSILALEACISALKVITSVEDFKEKYDRIFKFTVYCDTEYISLGIRRWIKNWIENGWIGRSGNEIYYKYEWAEFYELASFVTITPKDWITDVTTNKCKVEDKTVSQCYFDKEINMNMTVADYNEICWQNFIEKFEHWYDKKKDDDASVGRFIKRYAKRYCE